MDWGKSDDIFWVEYNQSFGLAVCQHRPLDYCVNDVRVFPLNNSDILCANNMLGPLCGHCNTTQCNSGSASGLHGFFS